MITGFRIWRFRIWQLFYYSVVRTNEHLNIRTKEYGSVAIHKATASRLGISHYVRNDKPVVVDKGTKKGGLAAFLCSLPYICWVIPSVARNLIQFGRMVIVQLFYYSIVRTNEHLNIRTIEYRSVAIHKAARSTPYCLFAFGYSLKWDFSLRSKWQACGGG